MSARPNVAHHPSEGRPLDGATPLDQSATAAAIEVRTVPTPNPNALMFRVDETLVPTGTFEYHTVDEAKGSPLAQLLLQVGGVDVVLVAPRFVTVTKKTDVPWPDVVPTVKDRIRSFLLSGEMAVLDDGSEPAAGPELGEIEQRIMHLIDEEIRPSIAMDGGDITFMGFVDGIVHLRLIGACGSCPSSTTTLKMGIERMLCEEVPEVRGVEQVF
jgi:NFU1 iron-sulfur cluster scaffold homolog, mitochondrial